MSISETTINTFYQKIRESTPDGEKLLNCLQCGNCSGVCPFGYVMVYPPSRMIAQVRANRFEQILSTENIWMCVSCYACSSACPAQIPITAGLMTGAKEELLLAGNVPSELQLALENSQRYGNPIGESPRKRADWAKDVQPEVKLLGKFRQPVDVLWFVGDYASYHPRVQQISKAFAKILNQLNINFGILGPEEYSDGDSQRLAGEKGLFEILAEKNQQAFQKYEFKEIITTDPHAYNAIKNEYPKLGISYPIRHYTEFLFDHIHLLRPLFKNTINSRVTYHDPCYLGRVNEVFEQPRVLLREIPGIDLVEMPHNYKNSLCCGGGGGGMWLDGFQWEKAHVRLSEWRMQEAMQVNAEILAVACPYETPRFEDAAKNITSSTPVLVKDIAELLVESMGI